MGGDGKTHTLMMFNNELRTIIGEGEKNMNGCFVYWYVEVSG